MTMKKVLMMMTLLLVMTLSACESETPDPQPSQDSDPNACVVGEDCESEIETPASELMDWEIIPFADSLDYVDGTAILFYSFDDCPYCKEAIPVLDEIVKDGDIKIYYVHTERSQREAGDPDYDRIYGYFKDVIEADGEDAIYMPSVFFIKDGEVVGYHVGTVDGHDPSVALMSDDQKAKLHDIYLGYYDLLKD